jgi:hypothetical protein
MALSYPQLRDALFVIKSKNIESMYYNFMQAKEKNPLIDHMQAELDIPTLSDVKAELLEIQKSKKGFFNIAKYPYYRQVMAYYSELSNEENLDSIVMMEAKLKYQKRSRAKKAFIEIKSKFVETIDAVERFLKEYDCLNRVLPLKAVISLQQAKNNTSQRLVSTEAFVKLFKNCYPVQHSRDLTGKLIDFVQKLSQSVPVYEYACLADESAVRYLERKLCPLLQSL